MSIVPKTTLMNQLGSLLSHKIGCEFATKSQVYFKDGCQTSYYNEEKTIVQTKCKLTVMINLYVFKQKC